MQNSNLYNNQYNEDLKKLMIKTMNFFKSSLYWLLYRLGFYTVLLGVAHRHDRPHGLWHPPPVGDIMSLLELTAGAEGGLWGG